MNVYSARVIPLGVAALAEELARRLDVSVDRARHLLDAADGLSDQVRAALGDPLRDGRSAVAQVIMSGKSKEPAAWGDGLQAVARAYARSRRESPANFIPVFVPGGGCRSYFYRTEMIERTYEAHGFHNVNVRAWRVVNLPRPSDLDFHGLSKDGFQRLAIAYGLSIPPEERSTLSLPREIDDPGSSGPHGPKPPYGGVRYEDSKEVLE